MRTTQAETCATTFSINSQPAVAIQRQDGFGMELHGLNRQLAVANAHDDPVFGFGRDLETRRKRFPPCEQRVVTAHL